MASNTNEDLEQTMKTLELKKSTCEKKNKLVKTAQHISEHETPVGEAIFYERKTERKDLTEKDADTSLIRRSCPDEQIKRLRVMFESVEDMLSSPDYDEDLKRELSAALPNFKNDLQTAKRDLLRNDCGIVVAGETSAGKTTLINQLVNKKVFATNNLAATGRITRIRNSESMKIKCYSKDEELLIEEDVQDEKKLKSSIKRLTKIRDDLKDIHFVDVYLPVSILKGNVIIIDTPGIGDTKMINNILLEFLPNAVAFVFVVNAKHAGGLHETRLLKILKTIQDNQHKMPCFDPKDALFLTNQWDIIDNDEPTSDEDEDQHTQTWNFIQNELSINWPKYIFTNLFRTSLKQVEDNDNTILTAEYKRFERVLKETIENNKNKRVVFYYGFLKKFIRHAERGVLARLNLLKASERDSLQSIYQSKSKIQDLELKRMTTKYELDRYKSEVNSKLAEKLYVYLQSKDGMHKILNPSVKNQIDRIESMSLEKEVISRVEYGIQQWCQGKEAESIIREADATIRTHVNEVESKLKEIEIEMTGIDLSADTMLFFDRTALGFLMVPLLIVSIIVGSFLLGPFIVVKEWYIGAEGRRQKAENIYKDCLKKLPVAKLKESFEKSFGVEYSKKINDIFDISLPKVIESLSTTNTWLVKKHESIKQKRDLFLRLRENIKKTQLATENFETNC